jgi:hypothetical protein
MNYEVKEIYVVFIAIIFLIFVNMFMKNDNNNIEGFAREGYYKRKYLRNLNYRYIDWYDWNYWLYYINPFYPPQQVDLPFEGRNGGVSWYEPWTGGIYNY